MFSFMKGATFRSESIYFWNNPIYIYNPVKLNINRILEKITEKNPITYKICM